MQQLIDRADAAATACKLQWEADVRSLEQQAAAAAAAAAAQQLSVELSLKATIKQVQQQKAAVMEARR